MRRRTPAAVALAVALTTVLCACGSRLPYDKVVAENATANGAGTSAGGTVSGTGTTGGAGTITASTGQPTSQATTAPSKTSSSHSTGQPSTAVTTGTGPAAVATTGTQPGANTAVGHSGPATGSVVNIGQIGTDSGVVGSLLQGARTGAQIWAAYINQHGGLNGHRVHLITADEGGDPSTGLSEAETMVERDHVIAFMMSDNDLSEATVGAYLDKVQVPVIGGDDYNTQWFTNPMFFPSGAGVRVITDAGIRTFIKQGHKNIGVVYCVEFAAACSLAGQAASKDAPGLGGKVKFESEVSLAQPDFTSVCLSAQSAGVDNLFLGLDPASITRLTADCANQGYHPHYATISLAFTNQVVTPDTNGLISFGSDFAYSSTTQATAAFQQAARRALGRAPDSEWEADAWVSGLILQKAARNLPANNPTSADVLAGLWTIKNDTFGGLAPPLTFTKGRATPSPTCVFEMEVDHGAIVAPMGERTVCLPASYSALQ